MMTTRGQLLLIAQRPGRPLGPPPERLDAAEAQAWHDIVAAVPGDVFRAQDGMMLELAARHLACWREGKIPDRARHLYRTLGHFLMPMAARRRLLFPCARPSRSKRV